MAPITRIAHALARGLFLIPLIAVFPARDAAAASGFFTTSDGVRLHYRVEGAGRTLLFVPGWTMPGEIWAPQVDFFSHRFQTVVLDPRAQGESQVAESGYDPKRRARDIKELIDALRVEKVVLIGWSLGVLEALAYVRFFGDQRLAGLVLVDNSIGEEPPPAPTNFLEEYKRNREQAMDRFVRGMFKNPRSEAYYDRLIAMALKTPRDAAIALLTVPYPREFWREAVYGTKRPVLYVVTPRFAEQARNFHRHRPRAWVRTFRHAGHALFVDEPQRFNTLLENFVRQEVFPRG